MESMYKINATYSIQMIMIEGEERPIRFNGKIVGEDERFIKIIDKFGEQILLNKAEIRQAKFISGPEDDSGRGDADGK
jgi:hypothetical protein